MTPRIAITTYPPNATGAFELPAAYVAAVRRAGGRPILIPPGETDAAGLLEFVDAVILAGGGDLDPASYGSPGHAAIFNTNADRDAFELQLAAQLLDSSVPTLAICRGLQVAVVAAGGTLHPHLPDVVGEAVLHRAPPHAPVSHAVTLDATSLVGAVMGRTEIVATSWHHQAVATLGDQFAAVGWAPDGTVEAVQHHTHPWFAAVQWHPELTADSDSSQQALFDALVATAGRSA